MLEIIVFSAEMFHELWIRWRNAKPSQILNVSSESLSEVEVGRGGYFGLGRNPSFAEHNYQYLNMR